VPSDFSPHVTLVLQVELRDRRIRAAVPGVLRGGGLRLDPKVSGVTAILLFSTALVGKRRVSMAPIATERPVGCTFKLRGNGER
jgi:hypothetical protein